MIIRLSSEGVGTELLNEIKEKKIYFFLMEMNINGTKDG